MLRLATAWLLVLGVVFICFEGSYASLAEKRRGPLATQTQLPDPSIDEVNEEDYDAEEVLEQEGDDSAEDEENCNSVADQLILSKAGLRFKQRLHTCTRRCRGGKRYYSFEDKTSDRKSVV